MNRLNRDTLIAVILLCMVGFFLHTSFGIRTPEFERLAPGQMDPGFWPRIILTGLAIMSVIYLLQSIVDPPEPGPKRGGIKGWLRHYRNPIICFAAFAVFLLLIPELGMLISGIIFVFGLMTLLGPKDPAATKRHILTSLCTVGGMWFIFACLLEVQLPKGELTGGMDEWLLINVCSVKAAIGDLFAAADGSCRITTALPV